MSKRIHVIINPAAGEPRPMLHVLNRVFAEVDVQWQVSVTQERGDAYRLAQGALAAGVDVVAAYGGDGTLMEVASSLIGSGVPLGILPGGTANVMSVELGIPNVLTEAAWLLAHDDHALRAVDMGQIGPHHFLLRAGIGLEAEMVRGATRLLKDSVGFLAYTVAALQAFPNRQQARYTLTLDGERVESEGLTCIICNSGNVGLPGVSLVPEIQVSDGLLDVIVLCEMNVKALVALVANVLGRKEDTQRLEHWQARQVDVVADPPQVVQCDGEVIGETPVHAVVIPQAVQVIVPQQKGSSDGGPAKERA